MIDVVYVTGSADKARLFSRCVGFKIEQATADVDEIQGLDLNEIVEHKAKSAFELIKRPVIVEDTKLSFNALGKLPGPLIKWFSKELGNEGLCRLLDSYGDRSAVAGASIAYFDGNNLEIFEKEILGKIALKPSGDMGFGWDSIFIPEGYDVVRGEFTVDEYLKSYKNTKPFEELRKFLESIDNI